MANTDMKVVVDLSEAVYKSQQIGGKTSEAVKQAADRMRGGATVVFLTTHRGTSLAWSRIKQAFSNSSVVFDHPRCAVGWASDRPGSIRVIGSLDPRNECPRIKGLRADSVILEDPLREHYFKSRLSPMAWCRFDMNYSHNGERDIRFGVVLENNGEYVTVTDGTRRKELPNIAVEQVRQAAITVVDQQQILSDAADFFLTKQVNDPPQYTADYKPVNVDFDLVNAAREQGTWEVFTKLVSDMEERNLRIAREAMLVSAWGSPTPFRPAKDFWTVPKIPKIEHAEPDTFRTELAGVFGLAPDAPDDVLLSTAKKAWAGISDELQLARDEQQRLKSIAEEYQKSATNLRDLCGQNATIIQRMRRAYEEDVGGRNLTKRLLHMAEMDAAKKR